MFTLVSCATTRLPLPSNTCKEFQGVWHGEMTIKGNWKSGNYERIPVTVSFGDNCRYIASQGNIEGIGILYTDDSGRLIYRSEFGCRGLVEYKTEG
jgi:hypothetical protein